MRFASFKLMLPRCVAGSALACLALLVSPAWAQEDGVFVDPDSPAAKEYALPLEQARREAGGGSQGAGADAAPLFGEGVKPSGNAATARGGDDGERSTAAGETPPEAGGERSPRRDVLPGVSLSSGDDGNGALALLLGGAGVLLLAGLGGFALRRRSTTA